MGLTIGVQMRFTSGRLSLLTQWRRGMEVVVIAMACRLLTMSVGFAGIAMRITVMMINASTLAFAVMMISASPVIFAAAAMLVAAAGIDQRLVLLRVERR